MGGRRLLLLLLLLTAITPPFFVAPKLYSTHVYTKAGGFACQRQSTTVLKRGLGQRDVTTLHSSCVIYKAQGDGPRKAKPRASSPTETPFYRRRARRQSTLPWVEQEGVR